MSSVKNCTKQKRNHKKLESCVPSLGGGLIWKLPNYMHFFIAAHTNCRPAASNIRDNECSLQLIYYQTCIRLIQGSIEFILSLSFGPAAVHFRSHINSLFSCNFYLPYFRSFTHEPNRLIISTRWIVIVRRKENWRSSWLHLFIITLEITFWKSYNKLVTFQWYLNM